MSFEIYFGIFRLSFNDHEKLIEFTQTRVHEVA